MSNSKNNANKASKYEIKAEQSVELLQELHILTRDGKLNQDSRRKLKQVYHLYNFIEPLLRQVLHQQKQVNLVDHGAGKSYLGFILYDLFFKAKADIGWVYGIEARAELVAKSIALQQKFGFNNMRFVAQSSASSINNAVIPEQIDVVTALHACDTASDETIDFALAKQAKHVVLVPCCQAQVANYLRKNKAQSLAQTAIAQLWRHPLHTREFASLLTNVLRCLRLQAHGYQVRVTELVGWEHSLKNELIIASYNPDVAKKQAKTQLEELLTSFNLMELKQRFAV